MSPQEKSHNTAEDPHGSRLFLPSRYNKRNINEMEVFPEKIAQDVVLRILENRK
jgi:hypothetical protein